MLSLAKLKSSHLNYLLVTLETFCFLHAPVMHTIIKHFLVPYIIEILHRPKGTAIVQVKTLSCTRNILHVLSCLSECSFRDPIAK